MLQLCCVVDDTTTPELEPEQKGKQSAKLGVATWKSAPTQQYLLSFSPYTAPGQQYWPFSSE